jgi:hypothetical protein
MTAHISACRWTTMDEQLMDKFQNFDVHGGPPVVYVPADKSPDGEPFFLGIMHHIERWGWSPQAWCACKLDAIPCNIMPFAGH